MATNQPTYHYGMEDIQRYLSGNMSSREMHEIEKAALNDPMLADALDGYKNADAKTTGQHLNEIKAWVFKEQVLDSPIPAPARPGAAKWWRWSAAATTLGIVAFATWFFLNFNTGVKNSEIAQNLPKSEATTENSSLAAPTETGSQTKELPPQEKEIVPPTMVKPPQVKPVSLPPTKTEEANPASIAGANEQFQSQKTENNASQKKDATNLLQDNISDFATENQETKEKKIASRDANRENTNQPITLRGQGTAKNSNTNYFRGWIQDQNGQPISGASILINNKGITSDPAGRFMIPATDSIVDASVSAIGFQLKQIALVKGRVTNVVLSPSNSQLNEVVVVGYGSKQKRLAEPAGSPVLVQQATNAAQPKGGWNSFYKWLYKKSGIEQKNATHNLILKIGFINETPKNFTIVQTPDTTLAKRVIELIKKGPAWENTEPGKDVEITLKVQ